MIVHRTVAAAVVAIALWGCGDPPPPDTAPQPSPAPAPEPPPPPKCEALDEGCTADASTEAPIPGTDFVFTPPSGWTYAKFADATIAQKGDEGPVLVMTSFDASDKAGELTKKRDEMVGTLAAKVGLEPKAGSLGKAQEAEMGALKMSLWEKPGAKRGAAEGAVLVFAADADGAKQVFGLGYAPREDEAGTAAILEALQSIQKADAGDASK